MEINPRSRPLLFSLYLGDHTDAIPYAFAYHRPRNGASKSLPDIRRPYGLFDPDEELSIAIYDVRPRHSGVIFLNTLGTVNELRWCARSIRVMTLFLSGISRQGGGAVSEQKRTHEILPFLTLP